MKLPPDQKFFVFDSESLGLHGQTFAVAGGIYDIHGQPVPGSEFLFSCGHDCAVGSCMGNEDDDRKWVEENVTIHEGAVLCNNPYDVRLRFWQLWDMAVKGFPGILMFVECGWPVEANFLAQCVADDPVTRNWSGPYPMHEIATLMLAAGMDPMATYDRQPHESPAHDPLADARLSARLLSVAVQRLDMATFHCSDDSDIQLLHVGR